MSYTDKFNSSSVPPAGASFNAITLVANATFAWAYGYTGSLSVIALKDAPAGGTELLLNLSV